MLILFHSPTALCRVNSIISRGKLRLFELLGTTIAAIVANRLQASEFVLAEGRTNATNAILAGVEVCAGSFPCTTIGSRNLLMLQWISLESLPELSF